ncbi:MAG TPA: PLP-dependent aminotransferase family protein [Xanthomonadales bacterium]|nr:PLP-dependent aminotransferase family protein [Xanthomonadales bacterium]
MTVTFDGAPPPGHINFGVGQPSADLLPVELLARASAEAMKVAEPYDFNYGEQPGDGRFRAALAKFLSQQYGQPAHPDSLLVTAGNSQALDFVCTRFTQTGDTVFVEEPSYFLAFQILRDHGLKLVSIPTDEHGMVVDQLEAELRKHQPKLVYTIPSFHNPGGQTLSLERRKQLLHLSQQHGFLIVADEVYQLLYFDQPPPPAFGSMVGHPDENGTVLSLGSFSKILAPGLRLGWIQASANLIKHLLGSGIISSGGSLNHMSSHIARQALELGLQEQHLQFLRGEYAERAAAMDQALHQHLGKWAHWQKPSGGYFFWLELQESFDAVTLRRQAPEFKTGVQAGPVFSNSEQFTHCIRLSFAHYNPEQINEGIARLAALFASTHDINSP